MAERLRTELRSLPTSIFIVCRRHSRACDGPFDEYINDTRPCPRIMAPLDIDSMIDERDWPSLSEPARIVAHQMRDASSGYDWSLADVLEHHRGFVFDSLLEATKPREVDAHIVIMPHAAVRLACTDAVTNTFEYNERALDRVMAWARAFCRAIETYRATREVESRQIVKFTPFERAANADAMNRFKREALCIALVQRVKNVR